MMTRDLFAIANPFVRIHVVSITQRQQWKIESLNFKNYMKMEEAC